MQKVIQTIFYFGPLLFGFGFFAPLFAQIITYMSWTPSFGLTSLMTGLILGGGFGLLAQIRGTWV